MMSIIIKMWEWWIIDYESFYLSIFIGRLSLSTTIPNH
jgi:hypothetical protein